MHSRREGAPSRRGRLSHGWHIASPILLHGGPAVQASLHHAVSFTLFLLPFADPAQRLFDPIPRDLRLGLLLIRFLLIGLVRLFLLLLFLLFLLLVLLLLLLLLLVLLL